MARGPVSTLLARLPEWIRRLPMVRQLIAGSASRTRRLEGEIHLADLIVALEELPRKNEAHARAIAGCLGFGLAAPDLRPSKPAAAVHDRHLPERKPARAAPVERPALRAPPPPPTPVALPAQILASTLKDLGRPATPEEAAPSWLSGDYDVLRDKDEAVPPRQSLIPSNRARGVLSATLATVRDVGEIDVDALIRRVVTGRIPSRLPRRAGATLSRGCQVLLDFADSMAPWWDDLDDLVTQVSDVVGAAAVSVFDFDGSPANASRWRDDAEREAWQPVAGVPILAASDLGVRGRSGRRALSADWHGFIDRCEAAASPLVILVPWPRSYWPALPSPYPDLVHWNPRTTAAMVRSEFGVGHGLRR